MSENNEMTAEERAAIEAEQARLEAEERAAIEAEQARLEAEELARQEHENFLNSFPETTVFYDKIIINGDVQHLAGYVRNAHAAEKYGWLDNHIDMTELTAIGTILYIKGHERPQPTRQEMIERICAEVVTGIQELLDATAHSKGYDSGEMLATYATDPDPEFSAQAQAYVIWRGKLWRKCYQVKDQVIAGEIEADVVNVDYIVNLVGPIGW